MVCPFSELVLKFRIAQHSGLFRGESGMPVVRLNPQISQPDINRKTYLENKLALYDLVLHKLCNSGFLCNTTR